MLTEVPDPRPGPGQVVVRVAAAGLCHSDLHVLGAAEGALPFEPPFTLGHEVAGWVGEVGAGVSRDLIGQAVAVYGPWGCGACGRCLAGSENYCDHRGDLKSSGAGLGRDGGMADFVLVPSVRHLLPLDGLDPVQAAPLTDAGLTPYHAIAVCRERLGAGTSAVVVGVGGLGHLAVQLLRELTEAKVIAVDARQAALSLASASGAELTVPAGAGPAGGADAAAAIRAATCGRGADAVFDFVGAPGTIELSAAVLRSAGDLVLVGSGGGRITIGKPGPRLAPGCRVSLPFWGSRPELAEVLELGRTGRLRVAVTRFPLSAAADAISALHGGDLVGRAVLVPD